MKKRFWILLPVLALCLYALTPLRVGAAGENEALRTVNLDPALLLPRDGAWALGDHELYFGQYGGQPTAYRVLSRPESQTLSGDSLLLDCGSVLRRKAFDSNFKRNDGQKKLPSEWKGSDLELWLNGSAFYESLSVFTRLERSAIAQTTLADVLTPYSTSHWADMYTDYGSTDRIFLLSAAEVSALYADDCDRAKDGATTDWWVRSAFDRNGSGSGSVHSDGHVCNNSVSNFVVGVSPAFNVRQSAIVLITPADWEKPDILTKTEPQPETSQWKLTLLDPSKAVTVPEGQAVVREGDLITVPYACEGKGITRLSLVITDGSQVLYYGALVSGPAEAGTGTFALPGELKYRTCGRDYFVCLLAERCNGPFRTDYASVLCPIDIPQ